MTKKRILLVEDDPQMASGLCKILSAEGFVVDVAEDGEEALRMAARKAPSLMILDVMIPKKDGFQVIRELRVRDHRLPVLMLTAKGQEADKVLGLELGADDYLTKPFGIPELLARVRALLRRLGEEKDRLQASSFAGLDVDFAQQVLRKGKRTQSLSHHENEILRLLIAFKGEPVARNKILSTVWNADDVVTNRVVDYHITNLRKKIEDLSGKPEPRHILTIHGSGYKFSE